MGAWMYKGSWAPSTVFSYDTLHALNAKQVRGLVGDVIYLLECRAGCITREKSGGSITTAEVLLFESRRERERESCASLVFFCGFALSTNCHFPPPLNPFLVLSSMLHSILHSRPSSRILLVRMCKFRNKKVCGLSRMSGNTDIRLSSNQQLGA